MANDLKFEMRVGQDGLTTGFKIATKNTEDAAAAIKTALTAISTQTRAVGKEIGDSIGAGTATASKGVEGFTRVLQEFKAEQVSNARQARFFGAEVASTIPYFEGAQGALQGLIGAALEGSAFGATFEIAKLGVVALADAFTEGECRAKEMRQVMRDSASEIADSMRAVAREVEGTISKTEAARRSYADKSVETNRAAIAEAQEYLKENHALRDFFSSWFTGDTAGEFDEVTGEWKSGGVKGSLVKSSGDIALEKFAKPDARNKQFDDDKAKYDATAAKERVRREEEVQAEIVSLYASTRDEILRIEAEKEQKLDALEHKGELDDEQFADQAVAIRADAARRIALLQEERQVALNAKLTGLESQFHDSIWQMNVALTTRVEALLLEQKKAGTAARVAEIQKEIDAEKVAADKKIALAIKVEQESLDARRRMVVATRPGAGPSEAVFADLQNKVNAERNKLGPDATDEEKQRMNQRLDVLQQEATGKLQKIHASIASQFIDPLVSDWNNAINQMIDGTFKGFTSIGELLEDVGKAILKSIVGVAFKAISEGLAALVSSVTITATAQKLAAISATAGNTAVAISGAAASQAFIPFVGPALGTAAATEMGIFLAGVTAPLLASASGGFDIPSGVNPLTQLHANEMVLPAHLADPLRDALAGGGMGGGDVHVHFHSVITDEKSMRRVVEGPEFGRAFREAARNGRF